MDVVSSTALIQVFDLIAACALFAVILTVMSVLSDVSALQTVQEANNAAIDDLVMDSKFSDKTVYAQDVISLFLYVAGDIPIEFMGTEYTKENDVWSLKKLNENLGVDYSKKYHAEIEYDTYGRVAKYVITEESS